MSTGLVIIFFEYIPASSTMKYIVYLLMYYICRAVRRSENPGVPGGHNLSPLVEIG